MRCPFGHLTHPEVIAPVAQLQFRSCSEVDDKPLKGLSKVAIRDVTLILIELRCKQGAGRNKHPCGAH